MNASICEHSPLFAYWPDGRYMCVSCCRNAEDTVSDTDLEIIEETAVCPYCGHLYWWATSERGEF